MWNKEEEELKHLLSFQCVWANVQRESENRKSNRQTVKPHELLNTVCSLSWSERKQQIISPSSALSASSTVYSVWEELLLDIEMYLSPHGARPWATLYCHTGTNEYTENSCAERLNQVILKMQIGASGGQTKEMSRYVKNTETVRGRAADFTVQLTQYTQICNWKLS